MSSKPDICSICGEPIKRQNMLRHYRKVHPRNLRSPQDITTKPATRSRVRRPRRILFYGLILVSAVTITAVAAQVINANAVRMRIQPQLSILIQGAAYAIPANIGIDQALWRDHSLDRYGIWGSSPLQTHDTSGTIYVESNTVRNFTLREFLAVWGESVDIAQVAGNPVQPGESACTVLNGQAETITDDVVLADQQKIALEIISGTCSSIG